MVSELCAPSNSYVKVLTPQCLNVTIFEERVFKEVMK